MQQPKFAISDKEKKKLIGSQFDEDEQATKQHFFNQQGKDRKNHKRWTGAFTGGFSAGYNNTVGSKEGWQPTQFVSSREKRATVKQTKVSDLFDEEEIMEMKMQEITKNKPMKFPTFDAFNSGKNEKEDSLKNNGNKTEIGEIILQNLINKNPEKYEENKISQKWEELEIMLGKKNQFFTVLVENNCKLGLGGTGLNIVKKVENLKTVKNQISMNAFQKSDNFRSRFSILGNKESDKFKNQIELEKNNDFSAIKMNSFCESIETAKTGQEFELVEGNNNCDIFDEPEEFEVPIDFDFYHHFEGEQETTKQDFTGDFSETQSKFLLKYQILTGNNQHLSQKFTVSNNEPVKSIIAKTEASAIGKVELRGRSVEKWDVKEETARKFGLTTINQPVNFPKFN